MKSMKPMKGEQWRRGLFQIFMLFMLFTVQKNLFHFPVSGYPKAAQEGGHQRPISGAAR